MWDTGLRGTAANRPRLASAAFRYEGAVRSLQEVGVAMQGGSWDEALGLYLTAKAVWQEQRTNCCLRWDVPPAEAERSVPSAGRVYMSAG